MNKLNHILIIDDDEINNVFSQIVLEDANAGNLISVCQSAQEALDLLQNFSNNKAAPFPDLILLDINMPDLDGFDFLHCYHNLGYHNVYNTAISMFSSSDEEDHKERISQYDSVIGFIKKPLSRTNLQTILTRRKQAHQ
ncbi:response regulator [Pontibacter vulgaris]|uniref:response regulator n=1 Tax=Pontibacter vulgaris TaxID=2905679 RepID=UPI001FA7382A|nr:response regulator [Pontibacter vulgaris]